MKLLRHEKHKLRKTLPPPFYQIQQESTGEIQGKEISTNGNLTKEVEERIAKAKNTWGIVNRRLLRNEVINPMVELILRNSIISSAAIYGLRKKELPRNLINQLETYMYKHIRTMMNPRWKDEAWYPEMKQL